MFLPLVAGQCGLLSTAVLASVLWDPSVWQTPPNVPSLPHHRVLPVPPPQPAPKWTRSRPTRAIPTAPGDRTDTGGFSISVGDWAQLQVTRQSALHCPLPIDWCWAGVNESAEAGRVWGLGPSQPRGSTYFTPSDLLISLPLIPCCSLFKQTFVLWE